MIRLSLTHRMARVSLAVALVASVCAYGFTRAESADAAQSGTLSLGTMTPMVATSPSQTVKLGGQLKIASGQSYSDVIVQLDIMPVQYSSQMSEGPASSTDEEQLSSVQDDLGDVSGTTNWSLSTTVQQMGLDPGTVYALDVEAWSEGSQPLGSVRTYLPYDITGGSSSFTPTQLAVLVPVTAASTLDGYQYQPKDDASTLDEVTSNNLISEMGQDGSLYKLLYDAQKDLKGVELSWAVDPDLLDTADQIDSGYFVTGGDTSDDEPGTGADDVSAWLKLAKSVLGTNGELWQLPSTDPDIGSLSHLSNAEAEQFLSAAAATTAQSTTLSDDTGRTASGLLAWPAGGQVNSTTLSLAQSLDPTAVVTASNSVNLAVSDDRYTPTGRASINGKKNIVVSDSDLDAIMSGDSADASYVAAGSSSNILAQQRLLAQTALIAQQRPNSSARTLLMTLPRDSAQADKDVSVLSALSSANWVRSTSLSTLLAASPDADATTGNLNRSATVTKTDLTTAQLDQAISLSSQLSLYQSILAETDTNDGLPAAVERTVSTSWRGAAAEWSTFSSAVQNRLTAQMSEVFLIQKSDLTMSGTSGSIPFTIHNGLSQRVTLGLKFSMKPTGRLDIETVPAVQIPAHSSRTIQVKVTSRSPSATIQVTAYLVNSAGAHYGDAESNGSQTLQVSVTSIGFVALLLFAGSAALLVIAVGLRIYRGRRGSRKDPGTREGD